MLEVDDRQKAAALKEAISDKMKNEVRLINNWVTMHVLDIDVTTTEDQVVGAIKNAIGKDTCHCVVKSMRPSKDGNQIATIQTNKEDARTLTKLGRIKIGWVKCRIKERVVIQRCYKCLEFGHRTYECRGPDRSDICIRCNQPGHRAKECTGTQHCPACKSNDHRSDTTRCPRFRALISSHRRMQKQSTSTAKL